jgi:hypothetical protein
LGLVKSSVKKRESSCFLNLDKYFVIDQAIHILLDRNSPWRSQVEEVIPQITGYSYETIKVGFTKLLSNRL